jgi:GGDEF domain-containing protein
MLFHRTIAYYSAQGRTPPTTVTRLVRDRHLLIAEVSNGRELDQLVNQSFPACIVVDATDDESSISTCRALKRDPFTAIIPIIVMAISGSGDFVYQALEAGADEVLTNRMDEREQLLRLGTALDRASRDVSVHPTTRLPGTGLIERDMAERLQRKELFAVCYADLDHFKEFNDRYGYNEGDGVILLLSRILRDIVKGRSPDGFIGHIGGDDFIFTVPIESMQICCEEILEVFDQLIPFQYSEDDRRAGYFLGKDRRGNVLRIPLMTLSIGVVTNQHRTFTHTARISELATEMKSYAKTLSGSVYAVDRRHDARHLAPAGSAPSSFKNTLERPSKS